MSDKEQDILQGNLIADEVSQTQATMTFVAICGEARAGKSKLIEQLTQSVKQLTSNSENTLTISEIIKDSTIEEELESQAQLDGILTELHEADERIAKDRQDTVRLGKETRAMLTDLRKQLG